MALEVACAGGIACGTSGCEAFLVSCVERNNRTGLAGGGMICFALFPIVGQQSSGTEPWLKREGQAPFACMDDLLKTLFTNGELGRISGVKENLKTVTDG